MLSRQDFEEIARHLSKASSAIVAVQLVLPRDLAKFLGNAEDILYTVRALAKKLVPKEDETDGE